MTASLRASALTAQVSRIAACIAAGLCFAPANAQVYLAEGTNISVDAAADGRLAIDLLGDIWEVPATGGEASPLVTGRRLAQRPRWSPNAESIVYEAIVDGANELRLFDLPSQTDRSLGAGRWADRYPDWHPDGDRVVFSSARHGNGFDIWEIDVPTELSWRLTRQPGNESEPAWSDDGRNLVSIHELDGVWSLVLRRRGRADEILISAESRLAAPSWRPDGTMITYLRRTDNEWSVSMTILSDPLLDRTLIRGEDFFIAPISWLDRQNMLYAANGVVRKREFNSWSSSNVPFLANVGIDARTDVSRPGAREIQMLEEPVGRTVVRAGRLYDGLDGRYRENPDIVIDGGIVTAVSDRSDHENAIVVDLGDLTVIPGLIDAHATLPVDANEQLGPLLLSVGVTTLVATHADAVRLNEVWSGKAVPGPRIVEHDWEPWFESGTASFLNNRKMPLSPAGRQYQDVLFAGGTTTMWLSGLADGATPDLDRIWNFRQAIRLSSQRQLAPRFSETPDLSAVSTTLVLGSKPNGLPPGIASQAELRAIAAAGLSAEQTLKTAGVNAAAMLGLGYQVGRIAVGSAADMLLIDGDPLNDVNDAIRIVGVVRNGRFFSVSGLLDRADSAKTVE